MARFAWLLAPAALACGQVSIVRDTTHDAIDARAVATGSCSSWTIGSPKPIANFGSSALMVATTAGEGALVGALADGSTFGLQLVHVDAHGGVDETPPAIVPAPYGASFSIAYALANESGHAAIVRWESTTGYAFTPINPHGDTTGPEVAAGAPSDSFSHAPRLSPTSAGFLMTEKGGDTSPVLFDFTGATQTPVSFTALFPTNAWIDGIGLDDGSIIGIGVQPNAQSLSPGVTTRPIDASGVPTTPSPQVLDPNPVVNASFFAGNIGAPILTIANQGMSVFRLDGSGAQVGTTATFAPVDGDCVDVAYAHGSILCVTTQGTTVDVQAFGYDGTATSSLLSSALPADVTGATTIIVPTTGGALVFSDPIVTSGSGSNTTTFAIEVTCNP